MGDDRPWNLVLHDGGRIRINLHLYEVLPGGSELHYGSVVDGFRFPAESLAGAGTIDGHVIRCESAEWALRCRTGYPIRAVDRHDVAHLCRTFGLKVPESYGSALGFDPGADALV